MARLGRLAQQLCCVHVRRGDYLTADCGFAHADTGWALPLDYYRRALSLLPDGLHHVLISDDPDWAQTAFDWLPSMQVSRGEPHVVDMFLLTRCRYNVIANSSFSWWGAYLNETPGRVVIAPAYHLGWSKRVWNPQGIRVDGWTYVEALAGDCRPGHDSIPDHSNRLPELPVRTN
jgi:hypothetical protein